eukprot:982393-Pyramimonas_sp.AAC.1
MSHLTCPCRARVELKLHPDDCIPGFIRVRRGFRRGLKGLHTLFGQSSARTCLLGYRCELFTQY